MADLLIFIFGFRSDVEVAGDTNVMVVSDFRRALPQFLVVAVKNLILLGKNNNVCRVCRICVAQ